MLFDKQPFPWGFRDKFLKATTIEDKEELCAWYTQLHREKSSLELQNATLADSNQRLRHENEFMLRLINQEGFGIENC